MDNIIFNFTKPNNLVMCEPDRCITREHIDICRDLMYNSVTVHDMTYVLIIAIIIFFALGFLFAKIYYDKITFK